MSYCWGVPFLIWKINNPAGDPTYQCQDLSRDRLVAGAVAYNGGGDPKYQAKINAALANRIAFDHFLIANDRKNQPRELSPLDSESLTQPQLQAIHFTIINFVIVAAEMKQSVKD